MGEHPAGDHVPMLGKVISGKLLDAQAEPMSYRQTGAMDGASALFPDVFDDQRLRSRSYLVYRPCAPMVGLERLHCLRCRGRQFFVIGLTRWNGLF